MSTGQIILGVVLVLVAIAGLVLHLRRRARRAEQPSSPVRTATLETVAEIYKRHYPLSEADRLRAPPPAPSFAMLRKTPSAWSGVHVASSKPPEKLAGVTLAAGPRDDLDEDLATARAIVSSLDAGGAFPSGLTEHTLGDLARRVLAQQAELAELRQVLDTCERLGAVRDEPLVAQLRRVITQWCIDADARQDAERALASRKAADAELVMRLREERDDARRDAAFQRERLAAELPVPCPHPPDARFGYGQPAAIRVLYMTICVRCGAFNPGEPSEHAADPARLRELIGVAWDTSIEQRALTEQQSNRAAELRRALKEAIREVVEHNTSASHVTPEQTIAAWNRLAGCDEQTEPPRQADGAPS